jgi:hypothetical protein
MSRTVHLGTGEGKVSIVEKELDLGKAVRLHERPLIVDQTNSERYGWLFWPRLTSS